MRTCTHSARVDGWMCTHCQHTRLIIVHNNKISPWHVKSVFVWCFVINAEWWVLCWKPQTRINLLEFDTQSISGRRCQQVHSLQANPEVWSDCSKAILVWLPRQLPVEWWAYGSPLLDYNPSDDIGNGDIRLRRNWQVDRGQFRLVFYKMLRFTH